MVEGASVVHGGLSAGVAVPGAKMADKAPKKLPTEIAREQYAKDNNVDLEELEKEDRLRSMSPEGNSQRNPLDDGEDEEEDDDDDDMPDSGLLPFLALFCMPCVGVVAVNKQKEIPRLHSRGEALLALDTAKRASHIGFLGVVFGTMLWMVVFGLIIKPQIASEPPCDNYPDCVPDEWLARTIAGSPPE